MTDKKELCRGTGKPAAEDPAWPPLAVCPTCGQVFRRLKVGQKIPPHKRPS